jgi:hypothetical protein
MRFCLFVANEIPWFHILPKFFLPIFNNFFVLLIRYLIHLLCLFCVCVNTCALIVSSISHPQGTSLNVLFQSSKWMKQHPYLINVLLYCSKWMRRRCWIAY